MIADILNKRKKIIKKIEQAGIQKSNLYAVLLYGSHLWGYDTKKSDIDLYVLVNEDQKNVVDIDNISLHYQMTPDQLREKVNTGSWASFFCVRYASYLVYGTRPTIPEYPKEKIIQYLDKNKELELDVMEDHSRSWCFQTLIKRIYFINYFYNDIKTFKMIDYQHCKQFSQDDRNFIEDQYVKIFTNAPQTSKDNKKLRKITLQAEEFIKKNI